jgi:glycine reductase
VISKELERAGIPTAQITTMTPIARMVGSNRIIPGGGIVHPAGNAEMDGEEERRLRRALVEEALNALEERLEAQKLYARAG